MVRGLSEGWRGLVLTTVVAAGVSGCDLNTDPDLVFVNSPVSITAVGAAEVQDSIEARVPVRVRLAPVDNEVPTPLRMRVAFSVAGEDCGTPAQPLVNSDEDDEAATVWTLGPMAGSCAMQIRALAPDGTALGFAEIDGTITPGRAVSGWLLPGEIASDTDTLSFDDLDTVLEDRFSNLVPWGLQVVQGPAIVLGSDLDEPASRTLVATGVGEGLLDVVTPWGVFLRAGLNVCEESGTRWIRAFRLADSTAVRASCP